ncbi:MAG: hypothetical protein M1537_05165 [Nitrospirae bacterium]|nr:hypothetical protein [Nitrospirota bacterium]MCL5284939.1 hypothetical protein [Nitrospirota bacterium]
MNFRRPLLVVNFGAGSRRRRAGLSLLLDSFADRFPEGIILPSLPASSLSPFFDRYADRDLLAVYGGDGSVHRAAGLFPPSSLPILVLPGGTGNVLARYLGTPPVFPSPASLWEELPRAGRLFLRPGMAGLRPFLLMAGAGWDGLAVRLVLGKSRLGSLAYYLAGLSSLLSRSLPRFSVTLTLEDGREISQTNVRWCLASRLPPYLGPFRTPGPDRPDSSLLHLTLVCGGRGNIVSAFAGLLPGAPEFLRPRSFKVREVVFHPSPGGGEIPFQADGEVLPSVPKVATSRSLLSFLCFRPDTEKERPTNPESEIDSLQQISGG